LYNGRFNRDLGLDFLLDHGIKLSAACVNESN
jgi:hypothetical protein